MALEDYFWEDCKWDDPCDDCTHWCEFLNSTVRFGVETAAQTEARLLRENPPLHYITD